MIIDWHLPDQMANVIVWESLNWAFWLLVKVWRMWVGHPEPDWFWDGPEAADGTVAWAIREDRSP